MSKHDHSFCALKIIFQAQLERERKSINLSLSCLTKVFEQLPGSGHISYRDHTLTMAMKDSLSRTSKTLMFVNVSSSSCNLSQTINSLTYAESLSKKRKSKDAKTTPQKGATITPVKDSKAKGSTAVKGATKKAKESKSGTEGKGATPIAGTPKKTSNAEKHSPLTTRTRPGVAQKKLGLS